MNIGNYKRLNIHRKAIPVLLLVLVKDHFNIMKTVFMERTVFGIQRENSVITEPIESLLRKIMNRYNSQPEGWIIMTDHKGNLLVLGPNDGYMLRIIPINPQEHTGVGVKIDKPQEIQRFVNGAPSYGFRPLSTGQTRKLLNGFSEGQKQHRLISEFLERKPVSIPELNKRKPKVVLSGPFISHPDLSTISESQRLLEAKLKIESEKLFRKRYPLRASIYG